MTISQLSTPLPQLAGIKVVEMGQNLAGPYASSILGELGAEVIKVEKSGGDDARGWGPPFVEGASTTFHLINRNKKSVVLSVDKAEDMHVFHDIIADADIFIHNLRPGVAEKLGLDAKSLMAINSGLIYCAQNAFGHAGPLQNKPGYEPLLQAFSGLVSINGDPAGPASRVGPSIVDLGTGMWTVIGALSALHDRARTGVGSVVATSLFETALGWVARHTADYGATGVIPPRVGTGHNSLTPYGAFDAADGPLVIAAGNDRLFAKLAAVVGHPEWSADERFATNAQRTLNRDTLLPMLSTALSVRTVDQWFEALEAVGVPCSPLQSVPQVLEHEQTRAIGMLLDAPGEQLKLFGLPLSIDGKRPGFGTVAPALGQHQHEFAAISTQAKEAS